MSGWPSAVYANRLLSQQQVVLSFTRSSSQGITYITREVLEGILLEGVWGTRNMWYSRSHAQRAGDGLSMIVGIDSVLEQGSVAIRSLTEHCKCALVVNFPKVAAVVHW